MQKYSIISIPMEMVKSYVVLWSSWSCCNISVEINCIYCFLVVVTGPEPAQATVRPPKYPMMPSCPRRTNNCCDIACPTFKLPHNTTGPFQSHQGLEGNNIPSIRWMSSAFHEVVRWHFSGVMGKSQSWLQFVLFWDNVNSEEYIWIILLKNNFMDIRR